MHIWSYIYTFIHIYICIYDMFLRQDMYTFAFLIANPKKTDEWSVRSGVSEPETGFLSKGWHWLKLSKMEMFSTYNSGWWFQPTPLKNDGVTVSWNDEIPNVWKVIKFHGSSHHQPGSVLIISTWLKWLLVEHFQHLPALRPVPLTLWNMNNVVISTINHKNHL